MKRHNKKRPTVGVMFGTPNSPRRPRRRVIPAGTARRDRVAHSPRQPNSERWTTLPKPTKRSQTKYDRQNIILCDNYYNVYYNKYYIVGRQDSSACDLLPR